MRHPHADMAIAWFNDTSLKLQYKNHKNQWVDCLTDGHFAPDIEYRIKPKSIIYRVALMADARGGRWTDTHEGADCDKAALGPNFIRWLGDEKEVEL
jgi:hypothetical protein